MKDIEEGLAIINCDIVTAVKIEKI